MRGQPREELWQVFEQLVEEKDLAIVETGEIWTVVPPEPVVVNSVQAQEVPESFVANFSNAPLEEVVRFVEQATYRRIVSDLRFSDVRIYFANDKPMMTTNELWEAFEQSLHANDLAVIREGEGWKVVSEAEVPPAMTIPPRCIAEPSPARIAP